MGKRKRAGVSLQFVNGDSTQCAFTGELNDTTARQALLDHKKIAQTTVNTLKPKMKELNSNVKHLRELLKTAEASAANHRARHAEAELVKTRSQAFLERGIRIDQSKKIIYSPEAPKPPKSKQLPSHTAGVTKPSKRALKLERQRQQEQGHKKQELPFQKTGANVLPVQTARLEHQEAHHTSYLLSDDDSIA